LLFHAAVVTISIFFILLAQIALIEIHPMKQIFPGRSLATVLAVAGFVLPTSAVAHYPDKPDQEKIVFNFIPSLETPGKSGLGVMNTDGSGRVILAEGFMTEMTTPALSPDGKLIAFAVMNPEKKRSDIFVMNRDGSGRKTLTSQGEGTHAVAPAWSADGKRIAYELVKGNLLGKDGFYTIANYSREIAVMDADGKNSKTLGKGTHPFWSPDGKKLLYVVVSIDWNFHLWSMDADGKNPSQVVKDETRQGNWSPDGKRIAFVRKKDGCLCVCNADGSDIKAILKGDEAEIMGFAWSADSKRLFVNRLTDEKKKTAPIFVVDADGSNLKQITKGDHLDVLDRIFDWNGALSPPPEK
jgi:Tol biopolymer transport system component